MRIRSRVRRYAVAVVAWVVAAGIAMVRPAVAVLAGVIFSLTVPTHPNATLACCTIPPPPPCDIHPEMCA
jgi:hypothetical protein